MIGAKHSTSQVYFMSTVVGDEYDPAMSLVEYLRSTDISKGTKQLCNEGGCGLCLVVVKLYEPVSRIEQLYAVNAVSNTCEHWEVLSKHT